MRSVQSQIEKKPITAKVLNQYSKSKIDFRFFLRAQLKSLGEGQLGVHILNKQQSFMVEPFVQSSHWVVMKEGTKNLCEGDIVDVLPVDL